MNKLEYLTQAFNSLRNKGIVRTQKEFAQLVGASEGQISKALKGDEQNLTDNLIGRIQSVLKGQPLPKFSLEDDLPDGILSDKAVTLPVLPTEAMAGTLGEFADSVHSYECERMISPIKGADYALKVCGDSMSPEYPSGCQILIKKVNEKAFVEWGKVYVLDTENGAVIKQIRKTDRENEVECVSLNPAYQPFTIDTSYINGWYRVLMVLALK